ncbi:MAG TPA: hypothetical protein GXX75_21355 [Clostridiales bacterium]|nr:hypothetical protein [Clostridiales bacterium]
MQKDRFAQIAASYRIDPARGLIEPEPQEIAPVTTELTQGDEAAFEPFHKSQTRDELYKELADKRKEFAPFLKNYAPAMEKNEMMVEVKKFAYTLDGEAKGEINIPHYQGPVGKHTAVYEAQVFLPEATGKRAILVFGGVDYKAEIYLNGNYAFSHEGFFSPFSGDVTELIHTGMNTLRIVVRNDYKMDGEYTLDGKVTGDKIYAATGLGWDEPQVGWHNCRAGMGIYNYVRFDFKESEYITDIFPRIYGEDGEIWVECQGIELKEKEVNLEVSIYGRNFRETIMENIVCEPSTNIEVGVGDSYTLAVLNVSGMLGARIPLKLENGFNRFYIPVHIEKPRLWTPETPWLYQVQIKLIADGRVKSMAEEHFGIREFKQDLETTPKGAFFLNGKEISLKGANTMGFEQQDVLHEDWQQLVDDILLAKLCNMNFLRITQRPVQRQVYDYCDMLGMMVQTDLPLFGVVRINQYCEVLRQAGEMEMLIRSHPACILVSYINERFPNANNMPHRMIGRKDIEGLFEAADQVVKLHNPERVIKHVDGDFDLPDKSMPDTHSYTLWYNGHGIDVGMLNKGYWMHVKPGWYCGCGEFGAEGLDYSDLMRRLYPAQWLKEPFSPKNIPGAQSAAYHYMFYETPHSLEEWAEESQKHQAFTVRLMASSMRRNPFVNSFAVHLFIDAFPSGWMKTIMDYERTPKPAYFAYRDCLSEVFCNIRTDRYRFFSKEYVNFDVYLCDEKNSVQELAYFVSYRENIVCSGKGEALQGISQGRIHFTMPETDKREKLIIYMGALHDGKLLDYTSLELEVFPEEKLYNGQMLTIEEYEADREYYEELVKNGEKIIISQLDGGEYQLFGKEVTVTPCRMNPLYFASRDTGHTYVDGFYKNDFAYWYDSEKDRLAPIVYATFACEGVQPILTAGNQDDKWNWGSYYVAAEWSYGKGKVLLCQLDVDNKEKNPIFVRFWNKIFEKK